MGAAEGLDGDDVSNLVLDPGALCGWGRPRLYTAGMVNDFWKIASERNQHFTAVGGCRGRWPIATFHGLLFHADDGKARLLTPGEWPAREHGADVVADDEGNLWVATTTTIARFREAAMAGLPCGTWHAIMQLAVFNQTDGLKEPQCSSPEPCGRAMRASDGRIWFATSHGLSVVDPRLAPELPGTSIDGRGNCG